MSRANVPLAVRTAIDLTDIGAENTCNETYAIGSFWPYSRTSFESRVVKGFKECVPVSEFEPHVSMLAEFYARQILRFAQNHDQSRVRFDWVVRVLASSETRPDRNRPLALLVDMLCRMTGASDATHLL
ncbi:MAG: hypothetical protein N3B12_08890, partial [Armatimonadetes bacterium]|nr:hypothetical protein [Armatimonadota bacterium]